MTLPVAAVADDVSFTSTGGTFSGTSQGYVLTDAILTGITGLGANIDSGADLGTVSFATAKLGSISNVIIGGPITPGGTLTISSNGAGGISAGALFRRDLCARRHMGLCTPKAMELTSTH